MSILEELDRLDTEIQSAERELNQAEGRKKGFVDTLEKEFSIGPEDIKGTLDDMEKELNKLAKEIEEKFSNLKENYEW